MFGEEASAQYAVCYDWTMTNEEGNPSQEASANPEALGFRETPELTQMRTEAVAAFNAGNKERYLELITQYSTQIEQLIGQTHGKEYHRGQLDLMISMAKIRSDTGRFPEYIEDLEEAQQYAEQMGLAEEAASLGRIITIELATKPRGQGHTRTL